jgi:hypothetical protein
MKWEQAYQLIIAKTVCGLQLNSTGRTITEVPPYICNNHDYGGVEGFRVKIGKTTFIQIPMTMLQTIYEDAVANGCIYNRKVFRVHYPRIAESSTGHPCHIHTVGKIFELSGVAEKINSHNYKML